MESSQNIIVYSAWQWVDIKSLSLQDFAEHIKKTSDSHVIYVAPEEYTFGGGMNMDLDDRKQLLYDVIDATTKRNVTISVIVGRHPDSFLQDYDTIFSFACNQEIMQSLRKFVDVYCWKDFWFFNTALSYLPPRFENSKNLVMSDRGYSVPAHVITPNINQVFCCMNRMPHYHRCRLVDEIASYDGLWDNNLVTWLITEDEYHSSQGTKVYDGYPWRHWQQTKVVRERFQLSNGAPDYCQTEPDGYYQTLFDIVPETDGDIVFWTEKTVRSIINFKPFLVVGGKHANHKLRELGFELYDEIFDYKFDDQPDYRHRVEHLVRNLAYLNYTTSLSRKANPKSDVLNQKYIQVREKLYHNFETLLHIMQNEDQIPLRNLISPVIGKYEHILSKNVEFVKEHFPMHTRKK